MQKVNLTLRLGGSLLHTVPKTDVTPAEILILQAIHGQDAVIDIRPVKFDKKVRVEDEWERLTLAYDRAGSFRSAPGEETKSIMATLFPGVMKKLPTTLKEIGLGHFETKQEPEAEPAPVAEAVEAAETAPIEPEDA